MIYVDTSVVLAWLFAEDRSPKAEFWRQGLLSSRLIEYEVWNRVHARGAAESHGEQAQELLDRFVLMELAPPILARALAPFPNPVRTLDALHLATLEAYRQRGGTLPLATYDSRMQRAAVAMGIGIYHWAADEPSKT